MKKTDVTYLDKINELRLDIKHPNNRAVTFVFLEGETDVRLFRKLFNLKKCKVENIPGGNGKLEECVTELSAINNLVLGIRDADFYRLPGKTYAVPNIFLTDFHDIEIVITSEDEVFSAILHEYTALEKDRHPHLRQEILKIIELVSYLKWLNDLESLEYSFDCGFQDLISFQHLTLDFETYFNRVLGKSRNAKENDFQVVREKIEALRNQNPNLLQLSNGHDFIKVISAYIRNTTPNNGVGESIIHSLCRASYTFEHFKKLSLYQDLVVWGTGKGCVLFASN